MKYRHCQGFTLIELAVVLAIIGVMLGAVTSIGITTIQRSQYEATEKRMDAIETAMLNFRRANGYLPCPADGTLVNTNTNFGRQAAGGGTATDCAGGSPAANYTIAVSDIAAGTVPVRTLGLPDEYSFDGWGNRFSYTVVTDATTAAAFSTYYFWSTVNGRITVMDAGNTNITTGAMYVLMSHGPNGHGAYTRSGGRKNGFVTNTQEQENCECDASAVVTYNDMTFVQRTAYDDPTSAVANFDDIVHYKLRRQLPSTQE